MCGRRAGKSFILALVGVYLACFFNYRRYLAPGERGTVLIIAADRKQARVILRYIRALLLQVPMLKRMVERETTQSFDLANDVSIEVAAASFRSTRGYAIVAVLADELAFWPTDDSAEPDYEVLNAVRPGMATIPNAMLLCASSPYAQRGALYDAHRKHLGKDGDPILVWQAATRVMNPTVAQRVIDEAMEADPAVASAEWMAQFRSDVAAFVTRAALQACVTSGVLERPPEPGVRYFAFTDPSGGSSDSFTIAIAHRDKERAVLDCVREVRPPFSPDNVTAEFAMLCKNYRVASVTGDRYAGEFPRELFRKHGVQYVLSERVKSEVYVNCLPLINAGRADLLDHPRLLNQFAGLYRRTSRGGRDSVDHGPAGHDDLCNAAAGALLAAHQPMWKPQRGTFGYGGHVTWRDEPTDRPNPLKPGPHQGCIPGKGRRDHWNHPATSLPTGGRS